MRILLVDESPSRGALLRDGLEMAGHEVVATLGSALALASCIDVLAPDVVVVDTESPTRDTLEHLVLASADTPRPIVMFSANDDTEFIRAAMRAGVTAYVASDIAPQCARSSMSRSPSSMNSNAYALRWHARSRDYLNAKQLNARTAC